MELVALETEAGDASTVTIDDATQVTALTTGAGDETVTVTDGKGTPYTAKTSAAGLFSLSVKLATVVILAVRAFLQLKSLHRGFTAPPAGSIGDRDQIVLDGVRLELQEAD